MYVIKAIKKERRRGEILFKLKSNKKEEKVMKKFKIEKNITIGQYENGMHWAEIKDDDGTIDMVLTASTLNELYEKIKEVK